MFKGYPKESITFLKQLEKNNNKAWFEDNKARFEKLIKEPSKDFVVEMGEHIQALVPTINALPKVNGSLFRIYRDVRFAKDKTPLKTRIGVIFWQGCGRRLKSSCFYLHFNKDEIFIAAGIRWFDRPTLLAYREYIKDDSKRLELVSIISKLKNLGFETAKAHYKRLPKGFDKDMDDKEFALMDAMFAGKTFKVKDYLHSEKLIDLCYKNFELMHELHEWVYELTLLVDQET